MFDDDFPEILNGLFFFVLHMDVIVVVVNEVLCCVVLKVHFVYMFVSFIKSAIFNNIWQGEFAKGVNLILD